MLIEEIISSVDAIQDPYLRVVTYAKIGEKLATVKDEHFKTAFTKAFENVDKITDPAMMFKALLTVGYYLKKIGAKSSNKVFQQVLEGSKILNPADRDLLMQSASKYVATAGDISAAIVFAMEIQNPQLRDAALLDIIKKNTSMLGRENIKIAYRLRKTKLALESISSEPYISEAYIELVRIYLRLGSYEKAINLLDDIKKKSWAKLGFREIIFFLKDKNELSHYVSVLYQIAERLSKKFGDEFLVEMARALALSGATDSAIKLIKKVSEFEKSLIDITFDLLEKNWSVIPDFLNVLSQEEKEIVGKEIMNYLIEHPEKGHDKLIKAVKEINSQEIMVKLVRYYILRGNVEKARAIALNITDTHLRSIALADVANDLLKKNRIADAIDTALEVRDPRFSSILISEILVKALDNEIKEKKVTS